MIVVILDRHDDEIEKRLREHYPITLAYSDTVYFIGTSDRVQTAGRAIGLFPPKGRKKRDKIVTASGILLPVDDKGTWMGWCEDDVFRRLKGMR